MTGRCFSEHHKPTQKSSTCRGLKMLSQAQFVFWLSLWTWLAPCCTAPGIQTPALSARFFLTHNTCYFYNPGPLLFDWPKPGKNRQKFSTVNSEQQSKISVYPCGRQPLFTPNTMNKTAFSLPPCPRWNDWRRQLTAHRCEKAFSPKLIGSY